MMGCALFSEIFLFSPEEPEPPPPGGLHVHGVGVACPALQPVVGGGGQVAEVILEGRVMPETETPSKQKAQDEVCEEQEAVRDQEYVEEILLDPDHDGCVLTDECVTTAEPQLTLTAVAVWSIKATPGSDSDIMSSVTRASPRLRSCEDANYKLRKPMSLTYIE